MNASDLEQAQKNLANRWWRLNHLYHIIDKRGQRILFQPNYAQQQIYENLWYNNVILKARQLGVTTFITLLLLDVALFNSNVACGIIADTEENAKYIFRKIKFAYDNLPEALKTERQARTDSAKELTFSNNSLIRVGTSLRSATFQYLLISEFGKVAAEDLKRAAEIVSGTLNTLSTGSYCFVESTARGRGGAFYDLCENARKLQESGQELNRLDFRFHFIPWWAESQYRLGSVVHIGEELHDYFFSLEAQGIYLDLEQKYWYAAKGAGQGEHMQREFPSTSDEAWQTSNEGLIYGKQMSQCRLEKRICRVPYDEAALVHSAWDLGISDDMVIWLFQVIGKEIHVIDYLGGSNESLAHWISRLKALPYCYGKHLAPHDILQRELSSGLSRQSIARSLGLSLIPVKRILVQSGIDAVRNLLPKCWFDEGRCSEGVKALENYKRLWNERDGCWSETPNHDWSSHASDAFRTLACGLCYIANQTNQAEIDREQLEMQRDEAGLLPGHFLYNPQSSGKTLGYSAGVGNVGRLKSGGGGGDPGPRTFQAEHNWKDPFHGSPPGTRNSVF